MANYYLGDNGELVDSKKKKKKNKNYTLQSNGKLNEVKTEDIAPVKEKKKDKTEERTWFQKGAYGKLENRFKDGYQFGDVSKTLGDYWKAARTTEVDMVEDFAAGFMGVGEKVVDAGATFFTMLNQGSMSQAAIAEMQTNALSGKKVDAGSTLKKYQDAQDKLEKDTAKFVAKDLYDENKVAKKIITAPYEKRTGVNVEEDSVLGDKSDSLVQSGGQLAAQLVADAILHGSGTALMATSAFGSEAESAFKQGATFDEAIISSTISAGAEMLSEKLGGVKFGGKTLTDVAFSKLSSKMTNKLTKALITAGKIGADATAEGLEEVFSGYMSAIGQKLTYMKDKEIEELFSNEDLLESFIGGMVLGGAFGGGEALISGRNSVNGMTSNEQAVVDKVYNDVIAEQEKGGKKLTSKEKQKIYENIVEKMDKGDIDIDTIEEVLGGSTFKEYKSITEKEKTLTDEISQLENTPDNSITVKQRERLLEAREELKNITNKTELKTKLSDEVYGIAKNSRLVESYNEKARKSQAFEADLTQYTGKQRAAVERAVKSGVLNNTNKSHALVDTLSKIEAEKGIIFDYTDNAKLKESGFAIEGKTVNGFVKNGAVTLNVHSSKAWQSTVGHEITHILEGTDSYTELQSALFEYAESKGELASRKAALTELYNGIDTDIDAELTADLVGDYLFSDSDFIKNLTGNKNLFQKIYDEIKYLCKIATGKELTQIEKVKREFDNAWKQLSTKDINDASNETADVGTENVKYSIREEAPPKETIKGYKVFKVVDGKLYPPMVDNPSGNGTPVGVWLNADVGGLAYNKDGTVKLNNNGRFAVESSQGGTLAFRPGWHLGEYPDASQFGRVDTSHPLAEEELATYKGKTYKNKKDGNTYPMNLFPYNFVWAECEVAADHDYQLDAMALGVNKKGSFIRTQAGLPYVPTDGYYKYRTNADPNTAPWIISGAIKVNRILDDAEVAEICAQHGVTPQTREGYTNLKKKDGGSRTPGNAINLADFGLEKGEVAPTDAAILAEIYKSDDVAKAQSKTAMDLLKTLPGYAKRKINFADENIIKEFGMNNQDVEYYRNLAESTNDGYLTDDNLYSEDGVQYSISNRKPIISKLTNREISEQSYSVLDRLGRG